MIEKKFIKMRCISYDTVSYQHDSAIYQLFVDSNSILEKRANLWLERELVQFLFSPIYKLYEYLIFEELEINNNYKPYFEVVEPIINNTNEKPGDIDLLLINKLYPYESLGFQVKKLKGYFDKNNINKVKFSNIEKGIVQANEMFNKYRFYNNFLMLIVANDGMNNKSENFFFRQPKGSEIASLYSDKTYEKLKDEIGIFIIEINQPISKDLKKSGSIATKLIKTSNLNIQSEEITNKIKLLIDG